MRVIVAKPGEPAEVREIENSLESLQEIVGGHIEVITGLWFTDLALICNEEGKIREMKPNRIIKDDIIVGPLILAGINERTGEFTDVCECAHRLLLKALDDLSVQKHVTKERNHG